MDKGVLYCTPHIAHREDVTEWVVLIGFVHVATMHKSDAVRKLLTVYQQVSTTKALPSVGN